MNQLESFKNITTIVLDVDGVLTDASVMVLPGGVWARRMNIKDGYALQLSVKRKYHLVVISGSYSPEVVHRLNYLGITAVFMEVKNKVEVLQKYLTENNLTWQEVMYMGDDIPDLEVMQQVALPCCPADAVPEIKEICKYISHLSGGAGCVRDIIEKIMKVKGDWTEDTSIRSK